MTQGPPGARADLGEPATAGPARVPLRILLSAYSCAPNRGSEPGIGWNTAIELARDHDVWVVVKERHRAEIEQELAKNPRERLHFVYYDVPFPFRWTSRPGSRVQLHYYLWQYGVYPLARRLCREIDFDVACHVTWGRYWSPSLFSLLPVPFVWSGVGGGEMVPPAMRAGMSLKDRIVESLKAIPFRLYRFDPLVRMTARRAALVLAPNKTSVERVAAISKRPVDYLETAVVDRAAVAMIDGLEEPAPRQSGEPVCFATLTRLIPWKGVHLGLEAFARLGDSRARYIVVGDGPERGRLEELARRLGIASQVEFRGNASRVDWMKALKECNAMVHPPLANSFNTIVLEAMLCGRPVITLKTDYLAEKLGEETPYFVDGSTTESAVAGLADAMRQVSERPAEARERGTRARQKALESFTWDARIERLNHLLYEVVDAARRSRVSAISSR